MRSFLLDLWQLFFRMVPHPTAPRLVRIGRPGRNSPVLVTVNSSLTVRRLTKALKGLDCYLLVAPAGGINVWCGSVGGHFNVESIISIIKTSGIERLVDHRRLILPQLSAPSITSKELHARCGWGAQFGPLRAQDIPAYLRNGRRVTAEMTLVRYTTKDRAEMAVAMSGSIIVRYSLFALIFFGLSGVLKFAAAVLLCSTLLHLFNERIPFSSQPSKALFLSAVSFPLLASAGWPLGIETLRLGIIFIGAGFLAGNAYSGYAPFKQCSYSKQFYGFKPLKISVVAEDCTGCTLCDWACPVDCFEAVNDPIRGKVFAMTKPSNCVECAACLVQCPTGAVINLYDLQPLEATARCS